MPARLLVTGVPRSGTTWLGTVLGHTTGAAYLNEPDNVDTAPFAMRAMAGLGLYPVLGVGDRAPATLTRLWDVAFGEPVRSVRGQQRIALALFRRASEAEKHAIVQGHRGRVSLRLAGRLAIPRSNPQARHRIVKSVRVALALDWLCERWNPTVLICRRHPLDVVASKVETGHVDRNEDLSAAARAFARTRFGVAEPFTDEALACTAWRVGFLMSVLDAAVLAHPGFHTIDHEDLCRDPLGQLRRLATTLHLEWSPESEAFVRASNAPGSGDDLHRIASEQPGKWRSRLAPDDAHKAARVLEQFPIAERYHDLTDITSP
jgi:hypothetical protein